MCWFSPTWFNGHANLFVFFYILAPSLIMWDALLSKLTLKPWFRSFGGVKGILRRSIGLSGVRFVPQGPWEVWVLEIFRNLIMLCLLNRYVVWFTKRICYYTRSLVQSISNWEYTRGFDSSTVLLCMAEYLASMWCNS